MKGIIFNLVEEVVTAEFGAEAWDEVLEASGLDGSYTSLGSYPDEHLSLLVAASAELLSLPPEDVVRTVGHRAIPLLATRYPVFFDGHTCQTFLLTLNDVIHPEVRKLYPGAQAPDFTFESPSARELHIGYESSRRLCELAVGFILGSADFYGERVAVDQPECMLRGDVRCLLRCRFDPDGAA